MELASGPPGVCDGSSPASQPACAPASKARRAPRSTRASGCGPSFAVLSRCACCALPHLGICLRRLGVNGRGEEHAHHGGLDRAPLPLVAVRGPRLVLPISLCCCGLRRGGRWVLRGQQRQHAAAGGGTGGPGGQLGPGIGGVLLQNHVRAERHARWDAVACGLGAASLGQRAFGGQRAQHGLRADSKRST